MRLARAFRRLIPVESQPVEHTPRQAAAPPDPEAGARWGRPAAFDIPSRQEPSDEPADFTVDWIDKEQWFVGTEIHREYASAAVPVSPATPELIRSVTFYCGTRTVRREVRGVIFSERTRDYLRFHFPFGLEGWRGEPHPPPSPEPEEF